jgi:hypothetical protein
MYFGQQRTCTYIHVCFCLYFGIPVYIHIHTDIRYLQHTCSAHTYKQFLVSIFLKSKIIEHPQAGEVQVLSAPGDDADYSAAAAAAIGPAKTCSGT